MKIVEFKTGDYGIRKWTIFGFVFLDLNSCIRWWAKPNQFFFYCKTKDLKKVKRIFCALKDNGKALTIDC